jgi:hypothetical protein
MKHLTLSPAYGRDYKSKADAKQAWEEGKDWTIEGMHPDAGRYTSIRDIDMFLADGYDSVRLRYNGLRDLVDLKLDPTS